MAKKNVKESQEKSDGKGKSSCCCAGCLAYMVISIIICVLIIIFIIVPFYKKYEEQINSNGITYELRNILADKIDDWNYRYVRPVQDKVQELQEDTREAVDKAKEKLHKTTKNPELIVEEVKEGLLD